MSLNDMTLGELYNEKRLLRKACKKESERIYSEYKRKLELVTKAIQNHPKTAARVREFSHA